MRSVSLLMATFEQTFLACENTKLVKSDGEPIYLPATKKQCHHEIRFAHGFFASALHEVAHWCIAGPSRRLQVDYGYWYEPETRSAACQHLFVAVEAKPQALEWVFAKACNQPFVISLDNPDADHSEFAYFKAQVVQEAKSYQKNGLPQRAERFYQALRVAFSGQALADMIFTEAEL